jgi:hypothetical protein
MQTHFLKVSTVLSAFLLAMAVMFGSFGTDIKVTEAKATASCTADYSTLAGAGTDAQDLAAAKGIAETLCTVGKGGTVTLTIKTTESEGVVLYNKDGGTDSGPLTNGTDDNLAESTVIGLSSGAQGIIINGDSAATTAATGAYVNTTLGATGKYTAKFTITVGNVPGYAVLGFDETGVASNVVYTTHANAASRANAIGILVLGNPVDEKTTTDDDGDGVKSDDNCDSDKDGTAGEAAQDTACSDFSVSVALAALSSTATVSYDPMDTFGRRVSGLVTLSVPDTTTCTWNESGTKSLIFNASATAADTAVLVGCPTSGNQKITATAAYSGSYGAQTMTANITRSDSAVGTVTSVVYTDCTEPSNKCTVSSALANSAELAAQDNDVDDTDGANHDMYYVLVKISDDAGNLIDGKTVSWTDGDGSTLTGAGSGLDVVMTVYDGATLTEVTHISSDTEDNADGSDAADGTMKYGFAALKKGVHTLTFKESISGISSSVTLSVRGPGTQASIAGPDTIEAGGIGVYVVSATDANGFTPQGSTAATFIVTGLGSGVGAGKSVPTGGTLAISATLGANITVVSPAAGGSGTVAVIIGTKVVDSKVVSYNSNSAATVSGTGCTGSSTGSYTCVVTGGGSASAIATAAGAVSVWQSDANGVLQGYVVGTPDFVDTGLASTASIASNSAIIVVR